jgi:hypothetical protein
LAGILLSWPRDEEGRRGRAEQKLPARSPNLNLGHKLVEIIPMTTTTTYRVEAVREGRWIVLSAPDVPGGGVCTQVRRIKDAEDMVREAITLTLEVQDLPADNYSVVIVETLPEELAVAVEEAKEAARAAVAAERRAAELSLVAVGGMRAAGYKGIEIARALDVSPWRVSQLTQRNRSGA